MNDSATGEQVVELAEKLDIAGAEALHLILEDALTTSESIVLNGSQVVKIDTAGVQVVAAFYQEAKNQHVDVTWVDPSNTLSQVFEFLKLSSSVGLDSAVQDEKNQELKND